MAENKEQKQPKLHGPMKGMMGGAPVEKSKNFKSTLKRLVKYLKEYRIKFIIIFILAALSTVFSIVGPKILGKATTELFNGLIGKYTGGAGIDFNIIGQIMITVIILYLISAVFAYVQQFMMAGVSQKIIYKLRKDVNDKFSKLPLKYFDANSKGDVLSRMTNDIDNISTTLSQSLTQLITSLCTIIGIGIMMFTINWVLAILCVFVVPMSLIVTMQITKRSAGYFKEQWELTGTLNGQVEETYSGHKIIKAFGGEKKEIEKFKETNEKLYVSSRKAQFISGIIMPIMFFLSDLNYVIICIVGAISVSKGRMNIGDIQAFFQYSRQFTQPISQTANIANTLQSTIASAERVFELLDEEEEIPEKEDAVKLENAKGNVKFENIDFKYKEDVELINNLNIEVKEGQVVAIVGPTGAGKTTLVNLLMRFYDVNSGKITVDSVDIRDMKRGDLRRIFGMVLQDTWAFNDTIKENIRYGKENATDEEVIKASEMAYADHFIRTFANGYETILDEEAGNISQGQKQLLTIARAFLADPDILILDEATSNVDTRTESLIQKAMKELMSNRTCFVIAHRLSTIKNADLILVMNDGKIIETGKHDELLKQDGFYADLYNSQFTECIDDIA